MAAAFGHPEVQEEIRIIARNNFQGNARAGIVFFATLLEVIEIPPARAWTTPPSASSAGSAPTIRSFSWLGKAAATGLDEQGALTHIERYLEDLENRQLLVKHGDGDDTRYFPNFSTTTRRSARWSTRSTSGTRLVMCSALGTDPYQGIEGLIAKQRLEAVRAVVAQPRSRDLPVRAVIAASLWPEALDLRSGGIADLAAITPASQVRASAPGLDGALAGARLAVLEAAPEHVERVIAGRRAALPPPLFTGGADLLRWARRREVECGELDPAVQRRAPDRRHAGLVVREDPQPRVRRLRRDRSDPRAPAGSRYWWGGSTRRSSGRRRASPCRARVSTAPSPRSPPSSRRGTFLDRRRALPEAGGAGGPDPPHDRRSQSREHPRRLARGGYLRELARSLPGSVPVPRAPDRRRRRGPGRHPGSRAGDGKLGEAESHRSALRRRRRRRAAHHPRRDRVRRGGLERGEERQPAPRRSDMVRHAKSPGTPELMLVRTLAAGGERIVDLGIFPTGATSWRSTRRAAPSSSTPRSRLHASASYAAPDR